MDVVVRWCRWYFDVVVGYCRLQTGILLIHTLVSVICSVGYNRCTNTIVLSVILKS